MIVKLLVLFNLYMQFLFLNLSTNDKERYQLQIK